MNAEIHLIHGFMGFGKTTLAKQLEISLPAVRFTHDEIMLARHGRTPDDFAKCYEEITQYIKNETIKEAANVPKINSYFYNTRISYGNTG